MPAAMKYSLLFAYESIAQNKLLQITLSKTSDFEGFSNYKNLTYDTLSKMQEDFESGFGGAFDPYNKAYNEQYYTNLCNTTSLTGISPTACASNTILSKGAKTSIYGLLSDASQLIITYNNYGAGVTLAQRQALIRSMYMKQAEEVFANVALVFDD
jgi:hypothetical protein